MSSLFQQSNKHYAYTGFLLWCLLLGATHMAVGGRTPTLFYFDAILPLWLVYQVFWKGFFPCFSDLIIRLGCFCLLAGILSSIVNYEDVYKSLASLKVLLCGLLIFAIMKYAPPSPLTLSLWGAVVGVLLLRNFHAISADGNLADLALKAEVGIVLGRSNIVASDLLLVFPLAIAGLSSTKGKIRLLFAGSAMLIFAGLIATMSRGAMSALVLATALTLPLLWKAGLRAKHIVMAVGLAMLVIVLLPSEMVKTDVALVVYRLDNPDVSREELMRASWDTFKENPVLGVGLGQLGNAISHQEAAPPDNVGHMNAHNLILDSLAENGFVGGTGFLVLIGVVVYRAWKTAYDHSTALNLALCIGLLAAVIHNMVEASIEGQEFQVVFWTVAAMIGNPRTRGLSKVHYPNGLEVAGNSV